MQEIYPPGWAKNATTPALPSETIFDQDYTPDWPSIPAGFDWVAVDMDGEVMAYQKKPSPHPIFHIWAYHGQSIFKTLGFIDAPPGDHWKTMIYERPTNTAA